MNKSSIKTITVFFMNWETYANKFSENARSYGYSQIEIDKCLTYASRLYERNIPVIYDLSHFALLVGYKSDYIKDIAYNSKNYYTIYRIRKKNGIDFRIIAEPFYNLKQIQRWILNEILYKCKISKFTKSYVKGKSIRDNARFHKDKKFVLRLDLKDFFPSLKYKSVIKFFKNLNYSDQISELLARLCCLRGSLPQGAPTSPALSNLLTRHLDARIVGFVRKHKINYTRYSDDLVFSFDNDEIKIGFVIKYIEKILNSENFNLNHKKTKLMKRNKQQLVTGVVVNKILQSPIKLRKKLRQDIYYISKYGLESHMKSQKLSKPNYIKYLLGIANSIHFINPTDTEIISYIDTLKSLDSIS